MSKAEDLLNSLTEEEKGAVYTVLSNEPHITVGLDRFITVPDQIKKIGVQYDHDIETITFDCPRFWDGNDLSTMKIYINYMREDGHVGMYLCDIVSIEDDIMHFNWTISGEVTQIKGTISFLVCIKRVDSDGNEERHWNSELCQDLYVSEGMECQESILYRYPDIITQLLTRMDIAEENVSSESILDRINEALDTNDTVNQTIKDKTVDYLESEITSKDLIVELPVGKWTKQYDNEYTQTVVIDGVDASINPIVSLFYSGEEATDDELNAYTCLSEVTTLDNAIKFVAIEKPSITFSVIVKGLTGVLLSDSIRLLIADKWSVNKKYKHGDYCIYNDTLWRFDSFGSEAEFVIDTPPGKLINWAAVNVGEELSKLFGISIIADKWSANKGYKHGDYCIYNDTLWRFDSFGGFGSDEEYISDTPPGKLINWAAVNVGEELSKLFGISIIADKWSANKKYKHGDYCIFDDSLWRCDCGEGNTVIDEIPGGVTAKWSKVSVSDILSDNTKNINKMKLDFLSRINALEYTNTFSNDSPINLVGTGLIPYTFEADGYLQISVRSGVLTLFISDSNNVRLEKNFRSAEGQKEKDITFVRKGMKLYSAESTTSDREIYFYKLT